MGERGGGSGLGSDQARDDNLATRLQKTSLHDLRYDDQTVTVHPRDARPQPSEVPRVGGTQHGQSSERSPPTHDNGAAPESLPGRAELQQSTGYGLPPKQHYTSPREYCKSNDPSAGAYASQPKPYYGVDGMPSYGGDPQPAYATQQVPLANAGSRAQGYPTYLSASSLGQPGSIPPPSSTSVVGPFLRFKTLSLGEQQNDVWIGSILIVSRTDAPAPAMELLADAGDGVRALNITQPLALDTHRDRTFWRFEVRVPLRPDREQIVSARIAFAGRDLSECRFLVAGRNTPLRLGFYSCNGLSADIKDAAYLKGPDTLWNDVFQRHAANPLHFMIGGGDQIYNDPVWREIPECKDWLQKTLSERQKTDFPPETREKVDDFYFNRYSNLFGNGKYAQALRSVPSLMVVDDHDIFDGAGTYPENVRTSPVMAGIMDVGYRYYLLFQQHTTAAAAKSHGFFGAEGANHYISQLSDELAFLGHDGRRERTVDTISLPRSYDIMREQFQTEIAPSTKHMLVGTGVPLLYPRLTLAENALKAVHTVHSKLSAFALFQKSGAFQSIMSPLANQPELMDDLGDHWTAETHEKERLRVIELFQELSKTRSIRVSFLGGDVHCCGSGRLKGTGDDVLSDVRKDPYFMLQVISSAIENGPPPDVVIVALHKCSQVVKVNPSSDEAMIDLFGRDAVANRSLSGRHKLINRRNWATIHQDSEGGLRFRIRVEEHPGTGKVGGVYGLVAPPLRIGTSACP